jgi:hypothetical protein
MVTSELRMTSKPLAFAAPLGRRGIYHARTSLALVLVACSSTTTLTSPFVGTWSCTETVSLSVTQPVGYQPQPLTEALTLTITDGGGNNLTVSGGDDAGAACKVTWTTSGTNGTTATPSSGQSCTTKGFTLISTGGTYTVNGNQLTGTGTSSFTGTVTDARGQTIRLAGTASSQRSCTKQ